MKKWGLNDNFPPSWVAAIAPLSSGPSQASGVAVLSCQGAPIPEEEPHGYLEEGQGASRDAGLRGL